MSEKRHTSEYGNTRRTFLKTIGTVTTVAGYGGISIARREGRSNWARPDGWTGPRSGPGRTGTTDDRGPTPYPVTDWKTDLDGSMYHSEPIVADDTLYLAVTTNDTPGEFSGSFGAYDLESGVAKWTRSDIPAPKTPTVGDEMIYIATKVPETSDSDDVGFYALDADSGDTMWSRTDHDYWSPPVVTEDRIYTSNKNATFAFDRMTGETVWEADGVDSLSDDIDDALSYTDGTVFVSDGTALDAEDGSTEWQVKPERGTLGNPSVRDGLVYYTRNEYLVGDDDRIRVQARSADTGEMEWSYRETENAWDGRPAVTQRHIFVVDSDSDGSAVTALDSKTGDVAWTTEIPGAFFSSPVVGDGTIYLGGQYVSESDPSEGKALIYALDSATGNRKWSYLLDSGDLETSPEDPPAAGTPVVSDGKLYAATYPAGSTLDYRYVYYSNFFVLDSCAERPDEDHRLPVDEGPDDGTDVPTPEACIEAISNIDWDDLDAGDLLQLDASCSIGRGLQFEWDIGGDGQYEDSGSSISVTVPRCGSLTVKLRITDTNDDTDSTSISLSSN
ncbi:PQQ-binding-like beta-propeller repeat protein [Haladaptatus caseinilyticus]|uniref:PQQ-binding-like beta-propeller repeat protein n=1 Tax=Haladaptatus caseinilyticus TaxID=2993314 RepID=UPI00224B2786|nr:PQQ-binding-like beta-propeller repeat protein [Haladaptatus caseinilyticus]